MAGAGSVSLGTVVWMTDATQPSPIFYGMDSLKAAAPAAGVATPVQPGTQDLSATVTVVFEID